MPLSKSPAAFETAPLVTEVSEFLRRRGETICFAESCTGGLLSASFAAIAGVSDVYVGAIVAYSNRVKEQLLDVSVSMLKSLGAVSTPVAKRMAYGARVTLGTHWAVSITGIAGPGGGTPQKPVGTVCFGVVGPGFEYVEQQLFDGDRRTIQEASARRALELVAAALSGDLKA